MLTKKYFLSLTFICLMSVVTSSASAWQRYSAKDVTPQGALSCEARGLNNHGQVVGVISVGDTNFSKGTRGFVTDTKAMRATVVDTLGGDFSWLESLNDDGVAVGGATTAGNASRIAIVVPPGSSIATNLRGLQSDWGTTTMINNQGWIAVNTLPAGAVNLVNTESLQQATELPRTYAGGISQAGTLVGANSNGLFLLDLKTRRVETFWPTVSSTFDKWFWVRGVNDRGEVIGGSYTLGESNVRAFITSSGGTNLRELGMPGWGTVANSISNAGIVVGFTIKTQGPLLQFQRAFVADRSGNFADLSSLALLEPNVQLLNATGINAHGQISASGTNSRCYLLTPIDH